MAEELGIRLVADVMWRRCCGAFRRRGRIEDDICGHAMLETHLVKKGKLPCL